MPEIDLIILCNLLNEKLLKISVKLLQKMANTYFSTEW